MPPKGWRKPKEEEASVPIVVTPPAGVMVKCVCGCPNHPQAVRCAACSRVLAK